METIFTNARVVTRDGVLDGTVVVRGDAIVEVAEGRSHARAALDLEGDYLLPGLIEIHTDNLEKHFQPRPGVHWPSPRAAVIAHDTQIIGAGITTVLDAMSVGDYLEGRGRREMLARAIEAVTEARARDMLRADHLLHMRCELSDQGVVEILEPVADHPLIRLLSLMDHTPGQRQWSELSKYRQFHRAKNWSDAEFEKHLAHRRDQQHRYYEIHRARILELARRRSLPLASHDDTTHDHVAEAVADGITISEFPTTMDAARLAREHRMAIVMGAPNVVRGGSHSGNVSALELAREGLLDGLSSDYVPMSLLHAAFILNAKGGMALHDAVAVVSANVADMIGLADRGRVAAGKRADLVRVQTHDDLPVVRTVWREGRRMM